MKIQISIDTEKINLNGLNEFSGFECNVDGNPVSTDRLSLFICKSRYSPDSLLGALMKNAYQDYVVTTAGTSFFCTGTGRPEQYGDEEDIDSLAYMRNS